MPKDLILRPIGNIHTPYTSLKDAPHQGRLSEEICKIEVFPEFLPGLKDIEKFTHLVVLYWMHLADRRKLTAIPPHNSRDHGVFSTRSPNRPNPIAMDVVQLLNVRGNWLEVCGMDALNGSILLDIKPYSAGIDSISQDSYVLK
ncbi:MAG: tRNA (N6-threonylcarbamoyladenosine(37)-N6)-methyltransferase TrmO [Methanotrichaceae archaeon]|nr:tRNA (N6-threonylcarbamoyladenosine(37)-N6)-methyltransferase TrmO [Methanotrichaceae archaeon]